MTQHLKTKVSLHATDDRCKRGQHRDEST
jgi:hypothetical protein